MLEIISEPYSDKPKSKTSRRDFLRLGIGSAATGLSLFGTGVLWYDSQLPRTRTTNWDRSYSSKSQADNLLDKYISPRTIWVAMTASSAGLGIRSFWGLLRK